MRVLCVCVAGGVLDGSKSGPLGIKPAQLTDAVFDYIFLGAAYPKGCGIDQSKLDQMRKEFEYWYVCAENLDNRYDCCWLTHG